MRKYEIDTTENKEFAKELCENLLSFGHRFVSEEGGAYYLGDDGTPWKDRPRETWITCRMAHVYSMVAMQGYEGGKELATAAIRGLSGELADLKAFLQIRDTDEKFNAVRQRGGIGIPCFVLGEGKISFDVKDVL